MSLNDSLRDPPPRDPAVWVPRAKRRDTDFLVDIAGPTTLPFRATVRNVSASGMLIAGPHTLSVGDVLTVKMPANDEMMCLIVRVNAKGAGVRFIQPRND